MFQTQRKYFCTEQQEIIMGESQSLSNMENGDYNCVKNLQTFVSVWNQLIFSD